MEFYSASPSTRRALLDKHRPNGTDSKEGEASTNDDDERMMSVFVEAKDKPQVTYTKGELRGSGQCSSSHALNFPLDGRKMINGKLLEEGDESSTGSSDPKKMWDKLILNQMAANIRADHSSSQGKSLLGRRKSAEKGRSKVVRHFLTMRRSYLTLGDFRRRAKRNKNSHCHAPDTDSSHWRESFSSRRHITVE